MKSLLLTMSMICLALMPTANTVRAEFPTSLTMVVMDPLAAPLSCPGVEGYAQRKYEVLQSHLSTSLGLPINLVFTESLQLAREEGKFESADLIIGKESVIQYDAKRINQPVTKIARLTGKNGMTTQTGLIVVKQDDPARQIADLTGYRIFFGPAECDEKHQAAMDLLKSQQVIIPENCDVSQACSDGACKVVEMKGNTSAAAVISSYAQPLLEGCGTIKKGDLRVIGETKPVPFVTAFVSDHHPEELKQKLKSSLLSAGQQIDILLALETLQGFIPIETDVVKKKIP